MNSSSVPAYAVQPRSARRASWAARIWRGEAHDAPAAFPLMSAMHNAVPGCHGTGRSVERSGARTKSP